MVLHSSSTLSVSEFTALVEASAGGAPLSPLIPCPRSASPDPALRGAPLRRMSGPPSSPHARQRSPSPSPYPCFDRCCGSTCLSTRRGSNSTAYSSVYSDDEECDSDGIIWFGKRDPPCSNRVDLFRKWVDTSTTTVVADDKTKGKLRQPPNALWTRLFLLWRGRRPARSRTKAKFKPKAKAKSASKQPLTRYITA